VYAKNGTTSASVNKQDILNKLSSDKQALLNKIEDLTKQQAEFDFIKWKNPSWGHYDNWARTTGELNKAYRELAMMPSSIVVQSTNLPLFGSALAATIIGPIVLGLSIRAMRQPAVVSRDGNLQV
jgi:hypothetical protein